MAPRETENNAYAKFGVTSKEHYGMLWYFLEWSKWCTRTLPLDPPVKSVETETPSLAIGICEFNQSYFQII